MKKALIIFVIFVAAALIWGVINFLPTKGIELADREQEEATTTAPVAEASRKLPAYKGWPIDDIGSDPFIKEAPQDLVEQYKKELTELKKSLTQNPDNSDGWLRAGLLQKFFNNYAGARDMWEYGTVVSPDNHLFYYNLGSLYGAYFKDYSRAEANYLQALSLNSILPYLYLGLAEFYDVFYTEKADQAVEVIKIGISLMADEPALKQALEYYQAK